MAKKQHISKAKSKTKSGVKTHRSRSRQSKKRRGTPWKWIGLGLFVLAVVVLALIFLQPKDGLPKEVTAKQAYAMYQQGAFFLDVRNVEEWRSGHIQGSVQIPLDELQSHLGELPRGRDIVLVCLMGVRSKEGVQLLQQAGFERVTCLKGGIQEWERAGYPLVKGDS